MLNQLKKVREKVSYYAENNSVIINRLFSMFEHTNEILEEGKNILKLFKKWM